MHLLLSGLFFNWLACQRRCLLMRQPHVLIDSTTFSWVVSSPAMRQRLDLRFLISTKPKSNRLVPCTQDIVAAASTDESVDPEEALRCAGVYFAADGAVAWVTPVQLEALEAELTAMETTMSYDLTRYYVTDCLLRARFANNRVRYVRTERGVEVEM